MLDGVGVGELPDAAAYYDSGSNTLGNIAKKVNGLDLPNLRSLGLGNITDIKGVDPVSFPTASFGKLAEVSKGKDSTTGHWELAGIHVKFDFSYYPTGFPKEMMDTFLKETGCKGFLGNKPASGTEIIKELGDEHVKTGFPIVYTSADSVFQIAAHEDVIPLEKLYEICKITREKVLVAPHVVGRVIARPFIGKSGEYKRTTSRKDFSLEPSDATVLDFLYDARINTISVGKVNELFANRGVVQKEVSKSNAEGSNILLRLASNVKNSLIFANLVDFDVYFGHRNDTVGFANALKQLDMFIPRLLDKLDETDALIFTADHGNDPTTPSTDHSREYIPLIFYRKGKFGKDLGTRTSFADVG
ncbi:MAG: phosphopentomutase, partial [Ignavibacteria bacterium]|nr:phosphopentomutase [Ignavibacteria bacterium]